MKEPKESFADQLVTWFAWGSFIASVGWIVFEATVNLALKTNYS